MRPKPEVASPEHMAIQAVTAKRQDVMWAGPLEWVVVSRVSHGTPTDGRVSFETSAGPLECSALDWVVVYREAYRPTPTKET